MQLDRLGDAVGVAVGQGEVVEADERRGVIRAQLELPLLEIRLVQLDRLVGSAGGPVGGREGVTAIESVGLVGAQFRLIQLERFLAPTGHSQPR